MYGVFDPLPWALFACGVLLCVLSVRWFHRKYPLYPSAIDDPAASHDDEALHLPAPYPAATPERVRGSHE